MGDLSQGSTLDDSRRGSAFLLARLCGLLDRGNHSSPDFLSPKIHSLK